MKMFDGKLITSARLAARTAATAASASTTTATIATATAATTTAAFFARACFVDFEIAAVQGLAGQTGNRCLGAFICGHGYKRETSGTAAHAVGDQINIRYRAKLFEEVLKIIFRGVEGKISHEQFITHCVITLDPLHFLSRSRTPGFKSITEHLFT
jgi:hypothetical protein